MRVCAWLLCLHLWMSSCPRQPAVVLRSASAAVSQGSLTLIVHFKMALPVTGRWMVGASKLNARAKYMRAAQE